MSGFSTARQKMVDGQVRTSDVTDHRILDAMLALPRENFVPEGKRALAYLDLDLDVAEGGSKRFLVKPVLTAKLLQAAELTDTANVLIVGCSDRICRGRCREAGGEGDRNRRRFGALRPRAKEILAGLGLPDVNFKTAEAAAGDPASAPYDAIILNGATEIMPETLCGQLKEGGRLLGVFATVTAVPGHDRHAFPRRSRPSDAV